MAEDWTNPNVSYVIFDANGKVHYSGFCHQQDLQAQFELVKTVHNDQHGGKIGVLRTDQTHPPEFTTVERKGRKRKEHLHEEPARNLRTVRHDKKRDLS